MNMMPPNLPSGTAERAWLKILARYRKPDRLRSAFELAVTVIPFAALWALSWAAVEYGHWWGLVLTIPAAGFLVRLFMIQHD
jgi:omega-6 fatty acid desaturase (delta-12 desaturase)